MYLIDREEHVRWVRSDRDESSVRKGRLADCDCWSSTRNYRGHVVPVNRVLRTVYFIGFGSTSVDLCQYLSVLYRVQLWVLKYLFFLYKFIKSENNLQNILLILINKILIKIIQFCVK